MKTTFYGFKLLVVFGCLISICQTARSQETDREVRLKGFVDTYHASGTERDGIWMSSRTRLRSEIKIRYGRVSAIASANFVYNPIRQEQPYLDLREAYLDYLGSHWEIKAGRQIVTHGVADGIRITDLVSPMDLSEFLAQDYDDIRMPVNALRLFYYGSQSRFELLAVPTFESFILPIDPANPWSIFPVGSRPVFHNDGQEPDKIIQNMDWGAYASFTLPGFDFSLSLLRSWNKMPVFQMLSGMDALDINLIPHYARIWALGADFSKPMGAFVLRAEGVYIPEKLEPMSDARLAPVMARSANALLGVDWYGPSTLMLSAQFSLERLWCEHLDLLAQGAYTPLATFRIGRKFLDEQTLDISSFAYYDLKNKGLFNRLAIDYAVCDGFSLSVGYDIFTGDKGTFGRFSKNDEAWMKARYAF